MNYEQAMNLAVGCVMGSDLPQATKRVVIEKLREMELIVEGKPKQGESPCPHGWTDWDDCPVCRR